MTPQVLPTSPQRPRPLGRRINVGTAVDRDLASSRIVHIGELRWIDADHGGLSTGGWIRRDAAMVTGRLALQCVNCFTADQQN